MMNLNFSFRAAVVPVLASTLVFALGVGCSSSAKKTVATPVPDTKTAPPAVKAAVDSMAHGAAPAKTSEKATSAGDVTCTHGEDSRVLAIESKGSGCSVNYTKSGKMASVANSATGTEYCEKTVAKIRGKLEAAGYTCK